MEMLMSAFEQRMRAQSRKERLPMSCTFELTPTCNLRCHFCYVALDPYQGPYLDTAQACQVLDIVDRTGVLWLSLTGGEVFSGRDFGAIYEHALAKGFLVTLYSNGTMVTEWIAHLLADLLCSSLSPFSIDKH